MRVTFGTEALITARKFHFLALVGRPRPDDGNNRNQGVDVLHIAHLAERDHGGAFDVMHGAGVAGGNELPNLRISPGFEKSEVRKGAFGLCNVPEGLLIIARRFNAGATVRSKFRPEGTINVGFLSRPFGTRSVLALYPTLKRWAIINNPS